MSISDDESFMLSTLLEDERREFFAMLAFRHCPKVGARTIARIMREYGSAHVAYSEIKLRKPFITIPEESIQYLRSELWRENAQKEWSLAAKCKGKIVLWTNEAYPSRLKEIVDAPPFLYARGNISLMNDPCIGIVGTREASKEGLRATTALSAGLSASGITIVSGLARGVDTAAHKAALTLPGKTIAVLGTGIDIVYPLQNEELYFKIWNEGLIVTEYAPGTKPFSNHFPIRNRIISGLSYGILVTEAKNGSGSLITAKKCLGTESHSICSWRQYRIGKFSRLPRSYQTRSDFCLFRIRYIMRSKAYPKIIFRSMYIQCR